ncbi:MAG: hypothetical protein R3E02_14080 [Blastomonas sp.]
MAAVPAAQPPCPHAPEIDQPCEVVVAAIDLNGNRVSEGLLLLRTGEALWIAAEDRALIGLADARSGWLRVDALPDIGARFDEAGQRLELVSASAVSTANRFDLSAAPDKGDFARATTALRLNYDIAALARDDGVRISALADAQLSFAGGYAETGMILGRQAPGGGSSTVRLDSRIVLQRPGSRTSIVIGDFISPGGRIDAALRIGGLRLASDSSNRPDLITMPLPDYRGSVALPSTIDLVAGDRTLLSREVEPGGFAISAIPAIQGRGEVSLVVRDTLGRERRETVRFYASPELLEPGLAEASFEIGLLRQGYGARSFDYGKPVARFGYRRGTTRALTLGARGEYAPGLINLGASGDMTLGSIAAISLDGAFSHATGPDGATGAKLGLGVESVGRPVSLVARYEWSSSGYRDVLALAEQRQLRQSFTAALGFDLGDWGNLDLGYVHRRETRMAFGTSRDADSRRVALDLLTASWQRPIGANAYLAVNLLHQPGGDGETIMMLGPVFTFGSGTAAGASLQSGAGPARFSAFAANGDILPGDWGYHAGVDFGVVDRASALIAYRGDRGRIEAGLERSARRSAARLGLSGALVLAGGALTGPHRVVRVVC